MVRNAAAPSITPAAAMAIARLPAAQQPGPRSSNHKGEPQNSDGRRLCSVFSRCPKKRKVNCGSFDVPFAGGGPTPRDRTDRAPLAATRPKRPRPRGRPGYRRLCRRLRCPTLLS
ncbi:hypothetical protein HPB50_009023 [Hyalomma asiaticum]|uniref:Uncharacterized protein n=1 Tax=Hyalomma asiaticum TaxID=266040 RepID=A0ACB7SWL1_HYAAI|nr:hypothetical protein HPB50_009023 [Hyalomma asiaticum]